MGIAGKERADILLVLRGLAPSLDKAQATILAGQVWSAHQRVEKPGIRLGTDADLRVTPLQPTYVSRGGYKLGGVLDHFTIPVVGENCLDIGASTGGFTDCLLQRGAALVMALDVGRAQLAARLRRHPRVVLLEKMNVRYLQAEDLPEAPDLVIADLAFISLTLVLPSIVSACSTICAGSGFKTLFLVKPQFEVRRGRVGERGVVSNPQWQEEATEKIRHCAESLGLQTIGTVESAIRGARGNREFFLFSAWSPDNQ